MFKTNTEIHIRVLNEDDWSTVQDHCFEQGIHWWASKANKFYPPITKEMSIIIVIERNKVSLMNDSYLRDVEYLSVSEFMQQDIKELLFDALL